MQSLDYVLAAQRGPMGWDYLMAMTQRTGLRYSYLAFCVGHALNGQG